MENAEHKQIELPETPYPLFDEWLKLADESEANDPGAMCLATVDERGRPSARMVLLKAYDQDGLCFYTNTQSRKGEQLEANQHVAVCLHWKSLRRQVRVEGLVEEVSAEEANSYFRSRDRGSRIGAWASKQSQPLGSIDELKHVVANYEEKFEGKEEVPRPPHWKGFRIKPDYFEFWVDGENRLHQRYLYQLNDEGAWETGMLYP